MAAAVEGASLEVRYVEPSLDLASLAACLADAVPAQPFEDGAAHRDALERSQPLLQWRPERGVLHVDTGAVLARLATSRDYRSLQPSADGGFIRDAPVPRTKSRAYLGGRIVEGSGGRLQQALDRLASRVEAEIERAIQVGFDPAALIQPVERALRTIGDRMRLDADAFLDVTTRVRRTTIGAVAATQREREAEIGRLMAAVEEVEGDRADHFERFAAAVREVLYQGGLGERAIASALEHHRDQAQRAGTQLSRFFDFLEDAALARLRLEVTFLMMEAIAAAAGGRSPKADVALLVAYVRRAAGLFRALTAPDGEDLALNLSSVSGTEADFTLHDELTTTGFAGCLPVWPEWVTQMFERQQRGPGPNATATREVSYRFRVNGRTQEDRKPAFVSRLARIRRRLLRTDGPPRRAPGGVRRSLAELVFLAAVIPADPGADASADSALADARAAVRALEQGGTGAIAALLDDLERRAANVAKVSRTLISVLKAAGPALTAPSARRATGGPWRDFYVNVRRSLIDQRRIGFAVDTPLMIPSDSPAREAAAFFRQIRITADRPLPGHLFSLRVRVRLAEGALRTGGTTTQACITRELPESWVQVAWCPDASARTTGGASVTAADRGVGWLAAPRVEVAYQLRWLGTVRPVEERLPLLAAYRCGFAILVYVVLRCVLRRARRAALPPDSDLAARARLAVGMFRMQRARPGGERFGGEHGVFAAAHAVELALGRDFDVRMQGLVLDDAGEETAEKRRGLYGTLFAGRPVVIERVGGAQPEPQVGLIVYGARPCNGQPERRGARGQRDSTLCVARTYLARAVDTPFRGYRIAPDAVTCEVRNDAGEMELPAVIVEEIRRLYEREGCRHVMVLSHRYGSRRIGWAAARMRAPQFPRLLAQAAARFPGLCLYPLVRDTFPVTRLRERFPDEDAFEILRPDEHLEAYPAEARELRHAYTPVYSLATLHVAGGTSSGEGGAGKPQSGFCTYFLLRESGAGSIEAAEQIRANFLLPTSPVRADLIAVLRGVHYLESERPATEARTLQPVLDPYGWLQPETIGHAGEILVGTSRRRAGSVVLSLPAVLERVSRVLHALPDASPPTHANQ